MTKVTKAAPYKKRTVEQLVKLFEEYPIVGVVNMENLPAPQLQKMREQMRSQMLLIMSKWRLMRIAIEQVKAKRPGIEELVPVLATGMPALLFTKENPIKIANIIMKNKTTAPAKPGQVAPRDIVVEAGPTGFGPGPIISDLSAIGLKTRIEGGKIAVVDRKVVVKEGDRVPQKAADVLAKLGVRPMEVGLDLVAAYENGIVYHKAILSVSIEQYQKNIITAHNEALAVAVEIGFMTPETVRVMIAKAGAIGTAVAGEVKYDADLTYAALAQAEKKAGPAPKEEQEPDSEVAKVENLYEELKKKGTLRDN